MKNPSVMNIRTAFIVPALFCASCRDANRPLSPEVRDITESVYASGLVKSQGQYEARVPVSGTVISVPVANGDRVEQGQVLVRINARAQQLSAESARRRAAFDDLAANQDKLRQARLNLEVLHARMLNDSALFVRQAILWKQNIGSKMEYEQRELGYRSSRNTWTAAALQLADLERQLAYSAAQSHTNLELSAAAVSDYTLRSKLAGRVYNVSVEPGEAINPQTLIAVVGSASRFLLQLQVDEYDIAVVKPGQTVFVTMDAFRGKTFTAKISRLDPLMNGRSKTFTVEARFVHGPPAMYPNMTLEANILVAARARALLIPREYLLDDSTVLGDDRKPIRIRTGLKDDQRVEVRAGLRATDKIIRPGP